MGLPGSVPQRNGLCVPVIDKGCPTGQNSSKLRARLQVGTGGHGSVMHWTSCSWHEREPGHLTPSQGSRHWQIGQPLRPSRANPEGQYMRHDEAGQSLRTTVQLISALAPREPTISTPYSSTHQHSLLLTSFEHCTGSNSPIRLHLGTLTRCCSSGSEFKALARLDSTRRRCWQAVRSFSGRRSTSNNIVKETLLIL